MPSISVIIPTWNRIRSLPRAIESAKNQSLSPLEIIVVDDGSDDGTAAMIRSQYPELVLLEQPNQGVSSARNTAICHAQGDWIALLDSDDEWLPEKLEQQLAAIASAPDTRLVHSDEIWIRKGVRVNAMKKHRKHGGWIYPYCLPLCAISPSAAMLRRDVFDDVGLFDELLPACEDYDYWLRFCAHEPVTYVDMPLLNKYGGHDDQLSSLHWGMDRFRLAALAKAIRSGRLSSAYLALTREQLARKYRIFLQGARKHDNHAAAEQVEALYHELLPDDP